MLLGTGIGRELHRPVMGYNREAMLDAVYAWQNSRGELGERHLDRPLRGYSMRAGCATTNQSAECQPRCHPPCASRESFGACSRSRIP
jgi:hypothetical protein